MATFNFDAFGNPVRPRSVTNGKRRAIVLHGDGVYDPALAACYAPIRSHRPASGLFTSPDICARAAVNPASFQRFGYARETLVSAADPI